MRARDSQTFLLASLPLSSFLIPFSCHTDSRSANDNLQIRTRRKKLKYYQCQSERRHIDLHSQISGDNSIPRKKRRQRGNRKEAKNVFFIFIPCIVFRVRRPGSSSHKVRDLLPFPFAYSLINQVIFASPFSSSLASSYGWTDGKDHFYVSMRCSGNNGEGRDFHLVVVNTFTSLRFVIFLELIFIVDGLG